jgi:hypothetical protein
MCILPEQIEFELAATLSQQRLSLLAVPGLCANFSKIGTNLTWGVAFFSL